LFENVWYDGTNEYGSCTFDRGIGDHNDDILASASLFFNYNWSSLLGKSVTYAEQHGLNPLNIYAGMNMQGGEGKFWTTLAQYPISIGLWGAHNQNMFWESRHELGSSPEVKLNTYLLRTERWFTGGTRNPANCPEVTNSMKYVADNFSFHGMSSFMTAKSTLSWDLAEEPFITYFNLGNGRFFNWKGERQHNGEWYNIGVQDYLPTWRWWFTTKLLGGNAEDVAENGLDAEFSWDEAWVGGSAVRVFGSTTKEFLHLFKTQYTVKDGDVVTFRYKLAAGSADMKLVLTAVGSETTPVCVLSLCKANEMANEDVWVEKKFVVGKDFKASDIALVALQFDNVKEMNL
jgi:endo-beta-N-acetylglucosaminidase D